LKTLLIYLGSNIKDVKPAQIREAVEKALEEGGVVMNTVFQQIREEGIEIGVKEGKDIGVKEGIEIGVKEGKDIGVKEGIEIGVKEGEEKNKLKVAFNCLIKGMDIETVAEITDLPIERIKVLKSAVQQENPAHL
jgi:predicted transposase YdaD